MRETMTFNTIRTGWIIPREFLNEKASQHYSKALCINPEFAEAHNGLGVVPANQGRINEAIIQFSEALRNDPINVNAQINLKNALSGQGYTTDDRHR